MPTLIEEREAVGQRSCWADDYWFRHCECYRVESPEGPIGYVESVELSEDGKPETLLVRVGTEFTHVVPVPAEEVEGIDPDGELILIGPLDGPETEALDRQLRVPALA